MQTEKSACLVLWLWLSRLLSVFKGNSVLQKRKNSNYLVANTGISPFCLHWPWVTPCMAWGDWESSAKSQRWLLWKNTGTWEHCKAFKNYFLLIHSKCHKFHKFHHFPEVMVGCFFFSFFKWHVVTQVEQKPCPGAENCKVLYNIIDFFSYFLKYEF